MENPLEDSSIVSLFWARSESAITESDRKYGAALTSLANRILCDREDSRESVNDTYMKAWECIPPHRPDALGAFLSKITRELSIDRLRRRTARKRQAGEYALSLAELEDCVSGTETPEDAVMGDALAEAIGAYLRTLDAEQRTLFVQRYYSLLPIRTLAERRGATQAKIKSALHRMRLGLRAYLEKEGWTV